MPIAEVNGQRIHYTDSGGDGPAVVFSHGLFMTGAMFDPQVAALRANYRCVTWDERGHGDTGPATANFTYYDSADDLVALLDFLAIERAVLVGMSQGGYLSMRAALTHPEVVAGLVLLATQAGVEEPEKIAAYRGLLDGWTQTGLTDELATVVASILIAPGHPVNAEWIARWRELTPDNLAILLDTLVTRDDITDRLAEIRVPALVVWGDQDLAVSTERAAQLATGLPDSELVVVPGVWHGANLTHPELVTPHLERFLNRVTATEAGVAQ